MSSNNSRFFPENPDPDSSAERKVWKALRDLPPPWRVFHSVAWLSAEEHEHQDGEADFVLLHPVRGLVVIEVKGGDIFIASGQWHSVDRGGEPHLIKNPFRQATASKHNLVKYLKTANRRLPWLHCAHAVVFPDLSEELSLGPDAPRSIIWYRPDLKDLPAALDRLVAEDHAEQPLNSAHLNSITGLLAPTVTVKPLLRDELSEVKDRLIQLTKDQYRVLDQLRRNRRALIFGGAGTGKTVLAMERARRLAAEGFRVLLTCYNRPLGLALAEEFEGHEGVLARHFHWLVDERVKAAGLRFPQNPSRDWWDKECPDLLLEAAQATGFQVDAIVVDEAQDFRPGWWAALQLLLTDESRAPIYAFVDPLQNLYNPDWREPFEGACYDLDTNCRNTAPIAKRVNAIFSQQLADLGVDGPEPEFVVAQDAPEMARQLSRVVHRLTNEEKIDREDIVVLSSRRYLADELLEQGIASARLVRLGEKGLAIETVSRFKGLECDVVVLLLPQLDEERHRTLAYIGMSRARAHLVVVGPEEVGERLGFSREKRRRL